MWLISCVVLITYHKRDREISPVCATSSFTLISGYHLILFFGRILTLLSFFLDINTLIETKCFKSSLSVNWPWSHPDQNPTWRHVHYQNKSWFPVKIADKLLVVCWSRKYYESDTKYRPIAQQVLLNWYQATIRFFVIRLYCLMILYQY